MDYKLNELQSEVKCERVIYPDMPSLLVGKICDGKYVFDATEFCIREEIEVVDYKVFSRMNKRYIEALAEEMGVSTTELFYLGIDKHLLISSELTFVFLAFAVPSVLAYFSNLLNDVMSNGIAFSDGFILTMATQRIPDTFLEEILSSRNTDGDAE